ncbi:hypothetical protein CC86DRAFT_330975, partial [Ophiobolus disseminans]
MILRAPPIIAVLALWKAASAEPAPEITTLSPGYHFIAKLPCTACPFLYHDATSTQAQNAPWKSRDEENALLLNISLPYTTPTISINTSPLLTPSNILPRISAAQVPLSISAQEISQLVDSNQLDTPGGATFAFSYAYSVRRIKDSSALLFTFDVLEAWAQDVTIKLDAQGQKVLEVVLLRRPVLSAGDADGYEIVRAGLVPRSSATSQSKNTRIMRIQDWDAHGEKGTAQHLVSTAESSFIEYITSGAWGLFLFIMAIIGLFVVLCLFCIFGCGLGKDEYESAQHGKRRGGHGGKRSDAERGKGRFLSAEELGIRSGGRVVGVGKSD